MAKCETCGNEYGDLMTVTKDGREHRFDSFECAIEKLAPRCEACSCRVIGHGVQAGEKIFCCAHCARQAGHEVLRDSA